MDIHKFGGASIQNAEAITNAYKIIRGLNTPLLLVFSAMAKTTNALERLLEYYRSEERDEVDMSMNEIEAFHFGTIEALDLDKGEKSIIEEEVEKWFSQLRSEIIDVSGQEYGSDYARIVGFGEYLSTAIMSGYLRLKGIDVHSLNARDYVITDDNYQHATVNWNSTKDQISGLLSTIQSSQSSVYVTQGFVGADSKGNATTLGREGSDYSASVFAKCLRSKRMYIWKDVEGVLTADPKIFPEAVQIPELDYMEALALTYYGASVIHPKTVRPLMTEGIELHVRPFLNPANPGSIVSAKGPEEYPCSLILKKGIAMIRIKTKDLGWIREGDQEKIFSILHHLDFQVYLAQNNPLSFIVVIDEDPLRKGVLMGELNKDFEIEYLNELDLLNVRHVDEALLSKVLKNKDILLEQRTSDIAQFVVEASN